MRLGISHRSSIHKEDIITRSHSLLRCLAVGGDLGDESTRGTRSVLFHGDPQRTRAKAYRIGVIRITIAITFHATWRAIAVLIVTDGPEHHVCAVQHWASVPISSHTTRNTIISITLFTLTYIPYMSFERIFVSQGFFTAVQHGSFCASIIYSFAVKVVV